MTDNLSPNPDSDLANHGDYDVGPDRRSIARTPGWVKAFGLIALALVVVFLILLLTDNGGAHGPGRHTSPTGALAGHTQPSSVK